VDEATKKKLRKRAYEKTKEGNPKIWVRGKSKQLTRDLVNATIKEQYGSLENLEKKVGKDTYLKEQSAKQRAFDLGAKAGQKARKWEKKKVKELNDPDINEQYEKLKKIRSKLKRRA